MLYGLKIALRYLTASKAQTSLLIAGVAVGVFVFIFMSALIGGLAVFLVQRTVGDIAHVSIEAPDRDPVLLVAESEGPLVVEQRATSQRSQLRTADAFLPTIETMPGVTATSQQIVGNGFLVRGLVTAPVSVIGVEANKVSAIADIGGALVEGTTELTNTAIIIGRMLADDLGIGVGQVVRLESERGVERPLVVSGVFELGVESLDRRSALVGLSTARTLFDLPQGISRIEIKLEDLNQANRRNRAQGDTLDRGQRPVARRPARASELGQSHQGFRPHHHRHWRRQRPAALDLSPPARDRHHARHRRSS
ncbi:MAG: lolE [Devosia sp.]|nr:lolE [Devosia sp.]